MAKNKPSTKTKKYRYFLQTSGINWDMLDSKSTDKYKHQDVYIKKSLKLTLDKSKAVSFPDFRAGEKGAEEFADNVLADCKKLYGKGFDLEAIRLKKPKKK